MIRLRLSGKYILPEDVFNNPKISIEENNRFITAEHEKCKSIEQLTIVSNRQKECARFFWNRNNQPLFKIISIETQSGCNLNCPFCRVDHASSCSQISLSQNLIEKIASELHSINYSDMIILFVNNEPLLDPNIISHVELFRKACPQANIKILTNGTLLTVKLAKSLFDAGLSTLTINNYSDCGKLIKPVEEILGNAETFLGHDLRISLRAMNDYPHRGDNSLKSCSNNRKLFCALPFVDLNVSSDGLVLQCSFDTMKQNNFGNIRESSLVEIWFNDKFKRVRELLLESARENIETCFTCNFDGFRDPLQDWAMPLVREDLLDIQFD